MTMFVCCEQVLRWMRVRVHRPSSRHESFGATIPACSTFIHHGQKEKYLFYLCRTPRSKKKSNRFTPKLNKEIFESAQKIIKLFVESFKP